MNDILKYLTSALVYFYAAAAAAAAAEGPPPTLQHDFFWLMMSMERIYQPEILCCAGLVCFLPIINFPFTKFSVLIDFIGGRLHSVHRLESLTKICAVWAACTPVALAVSSGIRLDRMIDIVFWSGASLLGYLLFKLLLMRHYQSRYDELVSSDPRLAGLPSFEMGKAILTGVYLKNLGLEIVEAVERSEAA
jgi:hypothetical protein